MTLRRPTGRWKGTLVSVVLLSTVVMIALIALNVVCGLLIVSVLFCRKYNEFYVFDQKLTEFHGQCLICVHMTSMTPHIGRTHCRFFQIQTSFAEEIKPWTLLQSSQNALNRNEI